MNNEKITEIMHSFKGQGRIMKSILDRYTDFSVAELMIIGCILNKNNVFENNLDGGISVSLIRDKLGISLPAVSQLLKNLESKGCVERNILKNDRRIILVSLTEEGCKLHKDFHKHFEEVINKIIKEVGNEEIDMYIKVSKSISRALDKIEKGK